MAELNPTPQAVAGKVGELREKFRKKYAGEISKGTYDQRDLDRLESDTPYASCFLRTLKSKGDPDKALDSIHESFKFRKSIGLRDLKETDFPKEILEKNAMYFKGQDKSGHPILYIDVKKNNAPADMQVLLKSYIAYIFEQHQIVNPEQMCVVLMDMSGAGVSNVSMDITKYIITCFTTYFPAFLAYMVNYEMPMVLSATWTIISAFLSSEQKKKLLVIKKKDVTKYIDEANLWDHMK